MKTIYSVGPAIMVFLAVLISAIATGAEWGNSGGTYAVWPIEITAQIESVSMIEITDLGGVYRADAFCAGGYDWCDGAWHSALAVAPVVFSFDGAELTAIGWRGQVLAGVP